MKIFTIQSPHDKSYSVICDDTILSYGLKHQAVADFGVTICQNLATHLKEEIEYEIPENKIIHVDFKKKKVIKKKLKLI